MFKIMNFSFFKVFVSVYIQFRIFTWNVELRIRIRKKVPGPYGSGSTTLLLRTINALKLLLKFLWPFEAFMIIKMCLKVPVAKYICYANGRLKIRQKGFWSNLFYLQYFFSPIICPVSDTVSEYRKWKFEILPVQDISISDMGAASRYGSGFIKKMRLRILNTS
jgi:hypothetical protein